MSASKKAAKKPAAKKAAKPAAPKKAQPKAKPAAAAKKAVTAGSAKKPAAKAKKADNTKAAPKAKAPSKAKAPAPKAKKSPPAPKQKQAPKAGTAKKPLPPKSQPKAAVKQQPAPVKQKGSGKAATAPKPPAKATPKPPVKKGAGKNSTDKKKAAKEKPTTKAQPKAPASGTKRASAPAALRSPAQATAAQARTASKKARPIFVKQSSSSKQDNNQPSPELDAKTKELVLSARKRTANGSSALKPNRSGKGAIAFTMDDVAQVLAKKQTESGKAATATEKTTAKVVKKQEVNLDVPQEKRVHSAVSLSDILGFNPAEKKSPVAAATSKGREVPRKWSRYFKLLVELREQVSNVLEQHTAETLKRSNRDDSGDLSGYGQHMADAGTDTFDRDFALSMVSSEQEALFEINEAIERIYNGSYGVCEITGETISAERLEAVPFTRYSLEGQKELEKNKRQKIQRGGVFTDNEDNISFDDDDN